MVQRSTTPSRAIAPTRVFVRSAALALSVALFGAGGAAAQSPDPGISPDPDASPGFTADPCAAFRQQPAAGGRSASQRVATVRAQALLQAETPDPYRCQLPAWAAGPAWSGGGSLDRAKAFHWSDPPGESVEPQGEIVGIGWVPLTLNKKQAAKLARSKDFQTLGAANKVIKAGDYLLVQVETAETPARSDSRNLSFHLGTDRNGRPWDNVPTSTADPDSLYQDLQDVYTLYLPAGRAPALYSTDFAGKARASGSTWYNARTPFAARIISDPPGVQFLVPAKGMGASFRPISFTDAAASAWSGRLAVAGGGDGTMPRTFDQGSAVPAIPQGSDFGALGTRLGLFPTGGVADSMVGCANQDVLHEAVPVTDLRFDGEARSETTMPSGTPTIWCTWPTFADGDILDAWFRSRTEDGSTSTTIDGTATVWVVVTNPQTGKREDHVVEEGLTFRVAMRGGNLYLGTIIGLTGYEIHRLKRITLQPTGNADADRLLQRSADAAVSVLPGWAVDRTQGRVSGDPACLPEGTAFVTSPR